MIDPKQGILTLCASGFRITPHTTPQALTEKIPSQIVRIHPANTGYTQYNCWLDVESKQYVWTSICFHGDVLDSIRLYPQHACTAIPAPQPTPADMRLSHPIAHAWYERLIGQDEPDFSWGSIRYVQGSDPIYHPTCIFIRFLR